MGMPNNLVLVRHGESEGNVAVARSKRGDDGAFTEEFRSRHSSQWRLSELGIIQAKESGRWLRENLGFDFERYYTSEYVRAMETAAHLELSNAEWLTEFYLRERTWGALDCITVQERETRYQESMRERRIDPFYWRPPNGESLAELCLRIDRVIHTLHRECDRGNVIIVCHGEVMWAFRVRLERMCQEKFRRLDSSKNPVDRIHNGQILHYTRLDPVTGGQSKYLNWFRSICPWEPCYSSPKWETIKRRRYSNEDLLKRAEKVPRLVAD